MLKTIGLTLFVFMTITTGYANAQTKTSVTIAAPWEVASFDPSVAGFVIQRLQIMENLVDADENGVLHPALSTAWTVSEDGLTWKFVLREGVHFHDGSPLTADAVVFALSRAWKQPGVLKKSPINDIAASRGKVVIKLDTPFTALPAFLAHATTVIPAPSSFGVDGKPVKFIGSGPFKVSKFAPPQSISIIRNDDYWGMKAKLVGATYLASSRAETRALLAESGDADIVFTLDASGYSHLRSVNTVETTAVPIPRVVVLKVNAGHPFFSEPKARRALSLATPREGIARAITRFPESAAYQLFPPVLETWHSDKLESLQTDIESAKNLFAELGWVAGEDGILTRDGERFSILLRTFPDRPELPLIATALQGQWREIGIELEVSVANYSEIPAGHQDGSLHVALFARNYGLTPDPIGTVLQDFGNGGGDWGAMGWDNQEVANALEVVASTSNQNLRKSNIAVVASALHQELPVIPIVWYQNTVSVNKKLRGVVIDPLQRSYGLSEMYWID